MFGLAVGGLCAPQHKWVSTSGRLWAAHTHRGAGPQRLLPWEEKEALCALAVLQGKYSCCSSVLNCSLFKEKSPDVKISSPLQHILATNSKSVAAFEIIMNPSLFVYLLYLYGALLWLSRVQSARVTVLLPFRLYILINGVPIPVGPGPAPFLVPDVPPQPSVSTSRPLSGPA